MFESKYTTTTLMTSHDGASVLKMTNIQDEAIQSLYKSARLRYSHHVSLFTQLCHRLVCISHPLHTNFISHPLPILFPTKFYQVVFPTLYHFVFPTKLYQFPTLYQASSLSQVSIYSRDSTAGILQLAEELGGRFVDPSPSARLIFRPARYSGLTVSCLARGKSLKAALEQLNSFDRY